MVDEYDRGSFRLDPQAKSFQMTGFRWRDAPVLLVSLVSSFCLITGFNIVAGFGLEFLNRDTVLVIFGVTLGYLAGVWVGARRSDAAASLRRGVNLPIALPLSDRVKTIADDDRKLDAVKAYQEESGAALLEAKIAVESYLNRERN